VVPVLPLESLTSYLNRVSKFHGKLELREFLKFLELPQAALISTRLEHIARLSPLLGLSQVTLSKMCFISHGQRQGSICGENVNAGFAGPFQNTFCAACLLEDGLPNSPSGGIRVGRITWTIDPIRMCPRHKIQLVRRKFTHHGEKLQLMSDVAPCDVTLKSMVESAVAFPLSDLQSYIEQRLNGRAGPEWLDHQPLDDAAQACELLGIALSHGSHCNLKNLSQCQIHNAGHHGYQFAARGENGIREALQVLYDRFIASELSGGPQKAFGKIYQLLQFAHISRPRGPIKDVVREFIIDTFPIEIGADLFGEPVSSRRVHTINSLARTTKLHVITLNRAIALSGISKGFSGKILGQRSFDAQEAEALIQKIENSITVGELKHYLNCNRVQAEQLVRGGRIKRILTSPKASGVLKNIPIDEADRFLSSLFSRAKRVDVPSEGMMDIVTASIVSRWPALDIIDAILYDKIIKVEVTEPALKFKGILVHPEEVLTALSYVPGCNAIGLQEAARILELPDPAAFALLNMSNLDGVEYIPNIYVKNSKGVKMRLFRKDDVEEFRRNHIYLSEWAEMCGVSSKGMRIELAARGILPIQNTKSDAPYIFRRADLTT
jgi:hypothetical protein